MPGLSRRAVRARKLKARRLLAKGFLVREVAEQLGVTRQTVRRWLRQRQQSAPVRTPRTGPRRAGKRPDVEARQEAAAARSAETVGDMIRAEGPAVARVLLDLAKGGDVRAATLVMKLLGNELTAPEERDGRDAEADQRELERELRSLPPPIAEEIVGLLAEAEAASEGRSGGRLSPLGGRGRGSVRLPWQAEDLPSDEGDDSV